MKLEHCIFPKFLNFSDSEPQYFSELRSYKKKNVRHVIINTNEKGSLESGIERMVIVGGLERI